MCRKSNSYLDSVPGQYHYLLSYSEMSSQRTILEWAIIVVTKHKQVKGTVPTVLIASIPSHWSDILNQSITYQHSSYDITPHCSNWVATNCFLGTIRFVRFHQFFCFSPVIICWIGWVCAFRKGIYYVFAIIVYIVQKGWKFHLIWTLVVF